MRRDPGDTPSLPITQHATTEKVTLKAAQQELSRSLRRRGGLILALFALLWAAVGASGLPSTAAWGVRIGAVVLSAGALVLTFRPGGAGTLERARQQPEGWYGGVGVVNLVQFVAIALAVVVLLAVGMPQLVPPAVCVIVGVHFFPLARLFDQPQYRWTGAGLCLAAGAGLAVLAVGPGQETSRVVIGLVAAGTLWATSVRLALRA